MAYRQGKANSFPFNEIREVASQGAGENLNWSSRGPDKSLYHVVFHADINDIIQNGSLKDAHPVALRFIHQDDNGRLNAYEVRIGDQNGAHVFNEINYGPFINEQKQLLESLEDHPALDGMEHAYLRLSALKIKAIWFQAAAREQDYFVPLSPSFYGLQAGKLYPAAEFVPLVVNVAKQVITSPGGAIDDDDLLGG